MINPPTLNGYVWIVKISDKEQYAFNKETDAMAFYERNK